MTEKTRDQKWLTLDQGVTAMKAEPGDGDTITLRLERTEILWVTALDGQIRYSTSVHGEPGSLAQGDSTFVLWPRGPWNLVISASQASTAAIFRISLDALHRILAVEFHDADDSSDNVDFRKFSRVVHLSPVCIRNLEKLFIQTGYSRFKAIARRGMFLNAFAELMEQLYGNEIDKCPFHIDADTERRIRNAQQSLVQNLDDVPDLQSLSIEVELPKDVLKEGFYYVFGKSIQDYVQDYKFEKAATMLESGKYLIKEVAFEIGYRNPSHFISAFKQRYGETPKQWVKQFHYQG